MAQNISPTRGGNNQGTILFQGYPTCFDLQTKEWKQLCEDSCDMELSSPPAIFLKQKGNCFHVIYLKHGFQHQLQNKVAVLLHTSTDISVETYGFAFEDEETGEQFNTALLKLGQYYKQIYNQVSDEEAKPKVTGKKPEVKKRPPMNDNAPYKSPEKLINQNANNDHQQKNLCITLSEAIEAGDVKTAKQIVALLVKLKVKLTATPMVDDKQSKFNILIQVESKDAYKISPIVIPVYPHIMTIQDLKYELYQKYDFPMAIQKFIIKNRLVGDKEVLYYCGVNKTEMIYLYLKSLDDAVFTKEIQTDPLSFPMIQNQYHQQVNPQRRAQNNGQYSNFPQQGVFPHQQAFLPPQQAFQTQQPFVPRQDGPQGHAFLPRQDCPQTNAFLPRQDCPQTNAFVPRQAHNIFGAPQNIYFPEIRQIFQNTNDIDLRAAAPVSPVNTQKDPVVPWPGKMEGWDCSNCTYKNLPKIAFCSLCDTRQPEKYRVILKYERPPDEASSKESDQKSGWDCTVCTYRNLPTFQGCGTCLAPRPDDYQIPSNYQMLPEERERIENATINETLALEFENERFENERLTALSNFQNTLQVMDQKLFANREKFICPICMDEIAEGEGVTLRECLHNFCKICLAGTIQSSDEAEINCPHNDGFPCTAVITMQEIEELLSAENYEKFLAKSLLTAERGAQDSFHCQTANCMGWCFYEYNVVTFKCLICKVENCLLCKAIHTNQCCKEYQDSLKMRAHRDVNVQKTLDAIEELITKGEAMHCPQCDVVMQKNGGCDGMKCRMCNCEICWATKGPRWGPKGKGDITGGCRCGVNGKRCHPNCQFCH